MKTYRWEKEQALYGFTYDGVQYVANRYAFVALQLCNSATQTLALRGFAAFPNWSRDHRYRQPMLRVTEGERSAEFNQTSLDALSYLSLENTVEADFVALVCEKIDPELSSGTLGAIHVFQAGGHVSGFADKYMAPLAYRWHRDSLRLNMRPSLGRAVVTCSNPRIGLPFLVAAIMPLRISWEAFAPLATLLNAQTEEAKANKNLMESAPDIAAERDRLKAINADLLAAAIWLLTQSRWRSLDEHTRKPWDALQAAIAKAKGETP